MSALFVRGSPKEQGSAERKAWRFDWAENLAGQSVAGQTVTAVTTTVTRVDTGANVTVANTTGSGSFTTTTTTTPTIYLLTPGKRYRVDMLATFSGGGWEVAALELICPF